MISKPPRPDEQEAHEAFERLVGGPERGFRLLNIYREACNDTAGTAIWDSTFRPRLSAADVFAIRARREGYTNEQIDALLTLQ